jgi:putative ABC transport system substrate-binding protein
MPLLADWRRVRRARLRGRQLRKLRVKLSAMVSPLGLGGALLFAGLLAASGCSNGDSAAAQSIRRVGLMHVGTDHVPPSLGALITELGDKFGWDVPDLEVNRCVEKLRKSCDFKGESIELFWRNLEPDQAEGQANEFVREHVDVIVAFEDQSIRAAQDATSKSANRIPIVFLHPSDPVRDGLVKSLDRPGGNLTGVFGPRDVVAKQLELYQLLVPRLRRVLTLVNPDDPATGRLLAQYDLAASQLHPRLKLDIRKASTAGDLTRIFHSLRRGAVDGAFLLSPTLRLNYSALTIRLAERAGIPVQAHRKDWVQKGALFSYGADLGPIGRAGARYVDSILRGTPPAKLPVEEVPTVEFAINLETASKLGIKIPQDMIIRADEVYR